MRTIENILGIVRVKKYKPIVFISGFIYFLIYLYTIGNLVYSPNQSLSISFVEDWGSKIFREIAPFIWEPIAVVNLSILSVFISIPNILIALLLSILIGLNVGVAFYTYHAPKICQTCKKSTSFKGILGVIPSFLTGFACCAPTFLIALGSATAGFVSTFITIRPILIPLSFVIMSLGLYWSSKRITHIHTT